MFFVLLFRFWGFVMGFGVLGFGCCCVFAVYCKCFYVWCTWLLLAFLFLLVLVVVCVLGGSIWVFVGYGSWGFLFWFGGLGFCGGLVGFVYFLFGLVWFGVLFCCGGF